MKSAILFGASSKGTKILEELKDNINVTYFCDNDSSKWGKDFCGVQVISPTELTVHLRDTDYLIITSSYHNEIELQLTNIGIKNYYFYEQILDTQEKPDYKLAYQNLDNDILIFKRLDVSVEILDGVYIDYLMNDYIYIDKKWEAYEILDWDHSWGIDPFSNDNWRLKLHILQPIYYLLKEYELTNNKDYLLKSIDITKSWIKENMTEVGNGVLARSSWAWNDHATADRVIMLTKLLFNTFKEDIEFSLLLIKVLKVHGNYLSDQSKYSTYNHGIMQDRALLLISVILPSLKESQRWYELAITRLTERITKDFSTKGVHLEHSASYHYVIWKMFDELLDFLKYKNLYNDLTDKESILEDMKDYLLWLKNSDGTLPLTGDTRYININKDLSEKHVIRDGLFCCKEAGVVIFNNQDDKIMFQSGFHSLVHKHADDCAFTIRIKGIDVFIDSGMYNYQRNNIFRKYVRSVFAHNAVSVDGKSYELINENVNKAALKEVYDCKDYFYVQGFHNLYSGVQYNRKLFYFKKSKAIFICDSLISDGEHVYSQIFNLSDKVQIVSKTTQSCILTVNKDFEIELKQLKPVKKSNTYFGSKEPVRGWSSKHFNTIEPIGSIDYEGEGSNFQFWTVINVMGEGIEHVWFSNDKWTFKFTDKTIITI